MNEQFIISTMNYANICLRTISINDQNNLREWKNKNRKCFFFQDIISESTQLEWFQKYLKRTQDYIFVVEVNNCKVGCMGVRLLDDGWDIYNIILGDLNFSGKGFMSHAFQMLCCFALKQHSCAIRAKVLCNNPALAWYKKNAFHIVADHREYVEIELDQSIFELCPITISHFTGD